MKRDLDDILAANSIAAVLVSGPGQHNPAMFYFTGGGHLTSADVIKVVGQPPVLFHAPMERDEAAKTGLATFNYNRYPLRHLMQEAGGNLIRALALRYTKMFAEVGLSAGRVVLYGLTDLSVAFPIFTELQRMLPDIEIVGDPGGEILQAATLTKDEDEVERIRQMGRVTVDVVGRTAEYLTGHAVQDEVLVQADGRPLTIADVKGKINLWLAEAGVENPEGTIFAIGRDGGVPHSSGNPEDVLRLGSPIVFDIFPCEVGGGYFFDFTRTWCLGYAPPEVLHLYEQVRYVYQQVRSDLKPGVHFREYQLRVCEMFEEMGHPTVHSHPETEEGYVHSLGHGVGLKLHERPFSGVQAAEQDFLQPGSVITVEPGLYYPARGMGVRLEDTLWVRPDGVIEQLVDYPLDLVLPMKEHQ
jgi:Xaa-Pro aminopeptidase